MSGGIVRAWTSVICVKFMALTACSAMRSNFSLASTMQEAHDSNHVLMSAQLSQTGLEQLEHERSKDC